MPWPSCKKHTKRKRVLPKLNLISLFNCSCDRIFSLRDKISLINSFAHSDDDDADQTTTYAFHSVCVCVDDGVGCNFHIQNTHRMVGHTGDNGRWARTHLRPDEHITFHRLTSRKRACTRTCTRTKRKHKEDFLARHAPLTNLDKSNLHWLFKRFRTMVDVCSLHEKLFRAANRLLRAIALPASKTSTGKNKNDKLSIHWMGPKFIFACSEKCVSVCVYAVFASRWMGRCLRACVRRSQSLCRPTSEFNRTTDKVCLICYLNLKSNR